MIRATRVLTCEGGGIAFDATVTAGVCTDCGAACASQMVAMDTERRTCHARCPDCHGKAMRLKAETADPSWFAAEERATR